MAQYSTIATQTVELGQNVLFTEQSNCGKNCSIVHTDGSGIISLKSGNSCCNPAQYMVNFGANIAVAEDGTAGEIALALAVNGEAVYSATAAATPAAIGDFWNVSRSKIICVPCGCCYTISLKNASVTDTAIDVENANISIARIC